MADLVVVEGAARERQPAELLGGGAHEDRVPVAEVQGRIGGGAHRARRALRRPQLPPAARGRGPGRGRLGHRRRRQAYLDMLAAYSAINFGHRHPRPRRRRQGAARARHAHRAAPSTTTSSARSARTSRELCGMELVLPMNTGAEGVETAIKTARKWGYRRRASPEGQAKIICCEGNFHGRTTTIVRFSHRPAVPRRLRPATRRASSSSRTATSTRCEAAIDAEHGRRSWSSRSRARPASSCRPTGYLQAASARSAREQNVLLHRRRDPVRPRPHRHDVRLRARGRAARHVHPRQGARRRHHAGLGGRGRREDILGVFKPGEHGSTFGGNPLGGGDRPPVIELLQTGELQENSSRLGEHCGALREAAPPAVKEVRSRGLWGGHRAQARGAPGAGRLPSGCSRRACSPRTRTTRRSASRRRS